MLDCIRGYKIPISRDVLQNSFPKEPMWSGSETKEAKDSIRKLIVKGAIKRCLPTEGQFISSYFLVPKPDGSTRFILKLKKFNECVTKIHFKMEDLRTTKKLIFPNVYMCNIDLKDAYFLIPVHKSSRKFLRFQFQGQLFEFTCLPFGLSTSPYVFTKVMRTVIEYLRGKGLMSSIYLDDILCIGKNRQSCLENVTITIETLKSLGFIINETKSCLVPNTRCRYLGFVIDSNKCVIDATEEKRKNLSRITKEFKDKESCKIREFARLIGSLVAVCPAVKYGMLYCRLIERERYIALLFSENDYETVMKLPETDKTELSWWIENLESSYNRIRKFQFTK